MNANRRVLVHRDAATVAAAAAARIITTLQDAQAERGEGTLVLTGGTLGIGTLAALAAAPALGAVDWSRVNIWWGDERFVQDGSTDRNAVQAEVLLTALDTMGLDRGRVHPMGSSDAFATPELAAADYVAQLAAEAATSGSTVSVPTAAGPAALPVIDVLLLGMGPDSHIASLFPDHAGASVHDAAVIGVRDSPKPPPLRVSLTFPTINTARQVWLLVSGPEKAPAVGVALGSGAAPERVPAAGARGTRATLWLVARDAAALI
ncbi:6-phosphogluconolactonase [Paeniglutamicibacter cryotolerans]|uniref:6-phosphogluconolactonase n=1 Tax=Paeniglutamicibacter cryotolerans TaxID=670079 RepID=A0A839QM00_9MICC|nr:6-phosphogluconolactonase [Paeniglutamicibacter cryotolerans]MBB2996877.1 6-phosphogluconolactonase [Paeniglutamicibacter cryotolerans]